MSIKTTPEHASQRRLKIMHLLGEWQRRYPETLLSAFAWWVYRKTGVPLTEIITEKESEDLMKVLGPDEVVAEALLEGLDSGP